MAKNKLKKPKAKKDSQLLIRISQHERDVFINACESVDTTAAREIRRFIRQFIHEHAPEESESSSS
jgi:hypothetical protein